MSADSPIVFRWAASSFFGWGIYGLNLMLHWPQPALTAQPLDRIVLAREDQRRRVEERVRASEQFHDRLKRWANRSLVSEMPVFVSYGNDLERYFAVHQIDLFGTPSIGFVFLEDAAISPHNVSGANQLPLMIAGSSWNAELLRDAGVRNVSVVLQGVDGELFRPRPRVGRFAGRFVVFSGGQSSFRKAQDLVLIAFRAFAERHREALLVAAWHSPWPERAQSFSAGASLLPPPPTRADGRLDPGAWARQAGLRAEQFVDHGSVPNCELPLVLAEADVALFPNRAEGGTNLIAMECLASGVPTILSANTGHLDLIRRTGTFAAERQRPVTATPADVRSTADWGESDVDELVELLESVYRDRDAARSRAAAAAQAMRALTWENQISELYGVVRPLL
jgi:glycosyltransferase involved in cell wall biosynthesis